MRKLFQQNTKALDIPEQPFMFAIIEERTAVAWMLTALRIIYEHMSEVYKKTANFLEMELILLDYLKSKYFQFFLIFLGLFYR
jgi:hypothetical protein